MNDRLPECGHTIFRKSCDGCRKLRKEMYQELDNAGFNDIEKSDDLDAPVIKDYHSRRFRKWNPLKIQISETYYYRAKELLLSYSFKNEVHRLIWELHCDGMPKRKIEIKIQNTRFPYKRESIGNIINLIAKAIIW